MFLSFLVDFAKGLNTLFLDFEIFESDPSYPAQKSAPKEFTITCKSLFIS